VADEFIWYHTERRPVTCNTMGILLRKLKENNYVADMPFSGFLSTFKDVRENIMAKTSDLPTKSLWHPVFEPGINRSTTRAFLKQ
jgi:hypothetical protein